VDGIFGARRVAIAYLAQQLGVDGYSARLVLLRRGTPGNSGGEAREW